MRTNYNIKIIIAALLHDIGKFYQRTGASITNPRYEQFLKNGGYRHAAYTAMFIEEYLNLDYETCYLSASHHITNYSFVKMADIYAAGHDRKSEESFLEETSNHYIIDRLFNIYYILYLDDHRLPSHVNLLKFSEYFPSKSVDAKTIATSKRIYNDLFLEFTADVIKINQSSLLDLYHNLYPLLKEYTTTICSSSFNIPLPTIGLFDHLKLTAAFASCLATKDINTKEPFLLLEYRLHNILEFVYAHSFATSLENEHLRLTAKSFYIKLLNNFLIYKILGNFNLLYENVLYQTSGRGLLLIPNTHNNLSQLENFLTTTIKHLNKVHPSIISYSFTMITASVQELQYANFKEILYNKERSKLEVEGKAAMLSLSADNNQITSKPIFLDNFMDFCNKYIYAKESFILEYSVTLEYQRNQSFSFGDLGFITVLDLAEHFKVRPNCYYETINGVCKGKTTYLAQSFTREQLFINNHELAIICGDVDNLGRSFLKGFQVDKTTISKILTLSRNTNFFFSKVLSNLLVNKKLTTSVKLIFGGGDDFVILAKKDIVPKVIYLINEEFNKYVGYNPYVTMSFAANKITKPTNLAATILKTIADLKLCKQQPNKNSTSLFGKIISNSELTPLS